MSRVSPAYAPLVVEVYFNPGEPSSARTRARVHPGQRFAAGRPVSWQRSLRSNFAPGSLLLVRAGESACGTKILCDLSVLPVAITPEQAAEFIRTGIVPR